MESSNQNDNISDENEDIEDANSGTASGENQNEISHEMSASEQQIFDICRQYGWNVHTDEKTGRIIIDKPNVYADGNETATADVVAPEEHHHKKSLEEIDAIIYRVVKIIVVVLNCIIFPLCVINAVRMLLFFQFKYVLYAACIAIAAYYVNPVSVIRMPSVSLQYYIRNYVIAIFIYVVGVLLMTLL